MSGGQAGRLDPVAARGEGGEFQPVQVKALRAQHGGIAGAVQIKRGRAGQGGHAARPACGTVGQQIGHGIPRQIAQEIGPLHRTNRSMNRVSGTALSSVPGTGVARKSI